jgi:hypothetical protein
MIHDTHTHTIINGAIGTVSSCFAVITTFQEQLEWWIRISGASLGLLIGTITLFNLLKKRISE